MCSPYRKKVHFYTCKISVFLKCVCSWGFMGNTVMIINIKVKVKLSLCLTKQHAMKTCWGSGGITPHILWPRHYMAVWSDSRPGRFTSKQRTPGTRWMGPRAGLDLASKRKIPSHRRESKPNHPIVQPVASHYTNWANSPLTKTIIVVTKLRQHSEQ
jgi:hypothetical protein